MNLLRLQAFVLLVLSAPFAAQGFYHSDSAAWGTAFAAIVAGVAIACLANEIE